MHQTRASLIWVRLARFHQQSNSLSNQFLASFDLTSSQFDLLVQIASHEPITQQQLASKVLVSEGGISRSLKRIEQLGWIERQKEWKTNWIRLTKKGADKLEEVYDQQVAFQSALFEDCLCEEEQKQLYYLLSKLQKNTENKLS